MKIDHSFLPYFYECCGQSISIEVSKPDIDKIKKIGREFNQSYYNDHSQFLQKINHMQYADLIIIKNAYLTVNFYYLSDQPEIQLASIIIHIINTMLSFFKIKRNTLDLYAFFTDQERVIDCNILFNSKKLKEKSEGFVVGGVTNFTKNRIILTKKEGIFTLLIHEICHYLDEDDKKKYHSELISLIDSVDDHFESYEVVAESKAILFYSAYLAFIGTSSYNDFVAEYDKNIMDELLYSYSLSKKIISLYGVKPEDFFNPSQKKRMKQPVMLFEYIIYRTMYLPYLIGDIKTSKLPDINEDVFMKMIKHVDVIDDNNVSYSLHKIGIMPDLYHNFWKIYTLID